MSGTARPAKSSHPPRHTKRNRAIHFRSEWKALRRYRGPQHRRSGLRQSAKTEVMHPKSISRGLDQMIWLKRRTIALALPSLGQQRLSDMRRGWCPFPSNVMDRVIRSDAGVAHRLPLSARVVSTASRQVKAKTSVAEALLTVRSVGHLSGFHALENRDAPASRSAGCLSKQWIFLRCNAASSRSFLSGARPERGDRGLELSCRRSSAA